MSSSCIVCEIMLGMLPSLFWASSLMESCFYCFRVKSLKDFREMTVARERSKLVPLNVMPMGDQTPLANASIEFPPVINVDVIRSVSLTPVIVLNRFIVLVIRSRTSISSRKNASISDNLFNRYVCDSCAAVGFKSG